MGYKTLAKYFGFVAAVAGSGKKVSVQMERFQRAKKKTWLAWCLHAEAGVVLRELGLLPTAGAAQSFERH